MKKEKETTKKRIFSLRLKISLTIIAMILVLSTCLVCVSYFTYKKTMDEHYETLGNNVAKTAMDFFDKDFMAEVIEAAQKMETTYDEEGNLVMVGDDSITRDPRYLELVKTLKGIRKSNNAMFLYMIYPSLKEDRWYSIVDADTVAEEGTPFGYSEEYYDAFKKILPDLRAGNNVPAVISSDYGETIITVSYPYTINGKMLGYVNVDISMDSVVVDRQNYLFNIFIILAIVTVIFAVIAFIIFNYIFVKPIKQMSMAADEFVNEDDNNGELSKSISNLRIKNHDELGILCASLKKMENSIFGYIDNLESVTKERERIGAELDVAAHIQKSMLPCDFPVNNNYEIYATMDPAKEVGGDFYDFFMVDEKHIAIVMADVSGKGVPAALFMVIGKTLIKDHTTEGADLGQVFKSVNNLLCEANSEGLFITAFEGVLDLETGEFRYVNAGHEQPFLYQDKDHFTPQKIRPGFVLAGMEDMNFRAGVFNLNEGDKIFEYTDGVTEATSLSNELYGMDRLENILNEVKDENTETILKSVKEDIDKFVGEAPQFDDITMLCLEFKKKFS